jgi:hypothetical protein
MAGGLAAGLATVAAAIRAEGYKWPWEKGYAWPWFTVTTIGITLGGIVAAAAHSQMSGPWPALLMGIGAPAVIHGALSTTEVAVRKRSTSAAREADEQLA